ncbi:MAG: zinc ribbon domain-containing protein [Oscillospiraceae bacterium]|nr:zinc ribbon domain-containing protein [Oscillospiraceae bacterium]
MPEMFDKIVGGINKGVATVGANSKAAIEKAKVNTIISNLEEERKQLAQLLGTKVHDSYKANNAIVVDESITNFIAEIDKRLEQIAEQQGELRRIEEEVNMVTGGNARAASQGRAACACGNANPEGAKFCVSCGSPL